MSWLDWGIDVRVGTGEIHALLGGNGAGKTTLIRIMTGTTAFDGGEIHPATTRTSNFPVDELFSSYDAIYDVVEEID